jgi:hypothetical protein
MKNIFYSKLLLMVFLALCAARSSVTAQQKVQVVTKSITRSFTGANRLNPVVIAEKATIVVNGWDKNELKVVIKLISKNIVRKRAESDLNILKYTLKETDQSIQISNFFDNGENYKGISSNLSAYYELWCPANSKIQITNLYGEITVKAFTGEISIKSGFCQVLLSQINGKVFVESSYDNLNLEHTNLTCKINADKTDINFKEVAGTYNIKAQYGSVSVQPSTGLNMLVVDALRTKVKINTNHFDDFNYELKTTSENIILPEKYRKMITVKSNDKSFSFWQSKKQNEIQITTTNCPIEINQK